MDANALPDGRMLTGNSKGLVATMPDGREEYYLNVSDAASVMWRDGLAANHVSARQCITRAASNGGTAYGRKWRRYLW